MSRLPTRIGTFSVDGIHPTRAAPPVLKKTTPETSFFKTLCRVVLMRNRHLSYEQVIDRVVGLYMPYIKRHYLDVRPDVDSYEHLRKEMRDAVGAVTPTLERYLPPYPNARLTKQKKAEVVVAAEVVKRRRRLARGQVAKLVAEARDAL